MRIKIAKLSGWFLTVSISCMAPIGCTETGFQGNSGAGGKKTSDPQEPNHNRSGLDAIPAGDVDPRDYIDHVDESGFVEKGRITDLGDFGGPKSFGEDSSDGDFGDGDFNRDEGNTFWIACDADRAASRTSTEIKGPKGMQMRLTGHFCPQGEVEQVLTTLFMIDFSGSMQGSVGEGPNDPLEGGSCGRLEAAKAVVDLALEKAEKSEAAVSAGMVGFSDSADVRLPIVSAEDFRDQLSSDNICGSDAPTALTNYEAAFETATAALAGVEGPKVIYFISDGSPTAGGQNVPFGQTPEDAGLDAAENLRDSIDDLTLNVVFLGYNNGDADNPEGYLEQVAGDRDRVKLVGDADNLVDEIKELEVPEVGIRRSSVAATLAGGASDDEDLRIQFVRKDGKGRYVFGTDLFTLRGVAQQTVTNTVRVDATTDEDDDLAAEVKIEFLQTN